MKSLTTSKSTRALLLGLTVPSLLGALSAVACSGNSDNGGSAEVDKTPVNEGGAPSESADECTVIPSTIDAGEELVVGPGCAVMGETRINGSLKIAPGTNVFMQRGASVSVSEYAVFEVGENADEPVVFQSARSEPEAGDWGCFYLASSDVQIQNVAFKHGGGECSSFARNAAVVVAGEIKGFDTVSIEQSADAGIYISTLAVGGTPLSGLSFDEIAGYSLFLSPDVVPLVGDDISLDADESAIVLNSDAGLHVPITLKKADYAYEFVNGELDLMEAMTIEPGVTLRLSSSVWLSAPAAAIIAEGTAEEPILWTSAVSNPTPDDYWDCIRFNTGDEVRLSHNHFEFAGKECNADPANGVIFFGVGDDVFLSDLTFKDSLGPAINAGTCSDISASIADWCAFDYTNVGGKLVCDLDDIEQCN